MEARSNRALRGLWRVADDVVLQASVTSARSAACSIFSMGHPIPRSARPFNPAAFRVRTRDRGKSPRLCKRRSSRPSPRDVQVTCRGGQLHLFTAARLRQSSCVARSLQRLSDDCPLPMHRDLFEDTPNKTDQRKPELGQWMTPDWAAAALVDQFFPSLTAADRGLEPTCGRGAFLRAIPEHVQAVGVEIDPLLAEHARRTSGRPVVVGDVRTTALPFRPTFVVGNPPFRMAFVKDLLDRAWELLPEDGQCALLLPAYMLQTPATVEHLATRWSAEQAMVPRTLFPRLSTPLCFAMLTKGTRRGFVGFALYHEAIAVARLQARYRALLQEGVGSAWEAVTRAAMESLGGRATLQQLYREIEGNRPTSNPFWKDKVRQVVQRVARRMGPGDWALRPDLARAA